MMIHLFALKNFNNEKLSLWSTIHFSLLVSELQYFSLTKHTPFTVSVDIEKKHRMITLDERNEVVSDE
jgi:hypothetical protein